MAFSSDYERPDHPNQHGEDEEMEDEDEDEDINTYKAMVPFSNLIPGNPALANCEFTPSPNSILLNATGDIPENTPLYIHPGPLPRSDLLRRLGTFQRSSSQYDVVEIDSTLIISVAGKALPDAVRDMRIEALVEEDILEDSYDIESAGTIPSEILIVIQAFSVDDATFQSYVSDEKFPKAKKDGRTRDILLEVIEKRRAMYDTTTEQDVALLRGGEEFGRRRKMAVEVRLGEKEILRKMEDVVRGWGDDQVGSSSGREKKRQRVQ
ncbi:hypothetical protein ABW19_dt0201828 [Dactylella cylindrospora]|nr:hypothetical protein ABW19_dt0201828 [Dactylella cylindrospora]